MLFNAATADSDPVLDFLIDHSNPIAHYFTMHTNHDFVYTLGPVVLLFIGFLFGFHARRLMGDKKPK